MSNEIQDTMLVIYKIHFTYMHMCDLSDQGDICLYVYTFHPICLVHITN